MQKLKLGSTVHYYIYILGENPSYQTRLCAEVDTLEAAANIIAQNNDSLNYIVIEETVQRRKLVPVIHFDS